VDKTHPAGPYLSAATIQNMERKWRRVALDRFTEIYQWDTAGAESNVPPTARQLFQTQHLLVSHHHTHDCFNSFCASPHTLLRPAAAAIKHSKKTVLRSHQELNSSTVPHHKANHQ
jgi:hypothetical protein